MIKTVKVALQISSERSYLYFACRADGFPPLRALVSYLRGFTFDIDQESARRWKTSPKQNGREGVYYLMKISARVVNNNDGDTTLVIIRRMQNVV